MIKCIPDKSVIQIHTLMDLSKFFSGSRSDSNPTFDLRVNDRETRLPAPMARSCRQNQHLPPDTRTSSLARSTLMPLPSN